jgi:23S rRNA (guanosine2251-2'-O)-methyltransferase
VIVAGRHAVLEALRSGARRLRIIHIGGGAHGSAVDEIRLRATRAGIEIREADAGSLAVLAPGARHQGIVAEASPAVEGTLASLLERIAAQARPAFVLALDELSDPGNAGAIVRTAECAGAHGVIMTSDRSAPPGGGMEKSSAGAVEYLPPARVVNLRDALERLKKAGCWIVGADAAAGKIYTRADFTRPVALVLGAEGRGLRRLTRETCDELVRIPLMGRIGSLNVSAAAAVLCYEVVRQRAGT